MKKYILVVLFFLNIVLSYNNGKIEFSAGQVVWAQNYGPEQVTYCHYYDVIISSYEYDCQYFATFGLESECWTTDPNDSRKEFVEGSQYTAVWGFPCDYNPYPPCDYCGEYCYGACQTCPCAEPCTDPYCDGWHCEEINISGDGADNNPTYTPKNGDKLFKVVFKQTMSKQYQNMCVPSIMEYVNHELCGVNLNQDLISSKYNEQTGLWPLFHGVDYPTGVINLANAFFNIDISGSNVLDLINQGCVIMTTMPSSIVGVAHNVLIVGYNINDGTLIYMNPEYGYLKVATVDKFNFLYLIGITGCK